MIDTDEYEERHIALMTFKGPDTDKLEAAHLIGFIIESCELQSDLLAEVKRLRGEPEVNCCPTCGSSDITIYDSFVDSGSHKVSCEADGCESRWFEIWRHVGIEMIEGDDNR